MNSQWRCAWLLTVLLVPGLVLGGSRSPTGALAMSALEMAPRAQLQAIDPTEVADLVARQASYQVSLSMQTGATTTDWEVTVVREPASRRMRDVTGGVARFHHIKIGEREWIGLGADPAWRSSDDPNLTQGEREGLARIQGFVPFPLFFNIEGPQASLTNPGLDVDGTTCDEYVRAEGETTLSICLSPDSGLPVRATLGGSDAWIEAHYSHFNAPANAIAAPTADFPERLHAADARMALNSLASFQWTASSQWEPKPDTEAEGFAYTYRGTYVQATQAWRAFVWEEDADGAPILKGMRIGERRWVGGGGDEAAWIPVPPSTPDDAVLENADPFSFWRQWVAMTGVGELVARDARTVDGRRCHDYVILTERINDQGTVQQETHLFAAADTGVPMRAESVFRAPQGTLTLTWELSHVDDPGNLVEAPG